MADVISLDDYRPAPRPAARAGETRVVAFSRRELDLLLQMYGRKVGAGECRDYALDFAPHGAAFAVLSDSSRGPDFRVMKWPGGRAGGRGRYAVVSPAGRVLRRGGKLSQVLKALEPRPRLL